MSSSFQGCIYADTPKDPHYQLSGAELRALQPHIVGLPVRVEHGAKNIGKVTAAWMDEAGHAHVRWDMEDGVRGWGLSKLIDDGSVTELSLKHAAYPDGRLRPIEVSVCERGARPGTRIVPRANDGGNGDAEYITASSKEAKPALPAMDPNQLAAATAYVLSALQTQQTTGQAQAAFGAAMQNAGSAPPVAAPPQEQAQQAQQAQQVQQTQQTQQAPQAPQVQQAPPQAQEEHAAVGAKRQRDESGRFSASEENETRRKKAQSDADRLMKVVESALPNMDPEQAKQLVATMTEVLSNQVSSDRLISVTQEHLAEALSKVTDQKNTHRDLAKVRRFSQPGFFFQKDTDGM